MDEIEQKVKKIVAEQLGIKEEDIKNESSFIEDLGADSLTTVEMSLALEDAFGIEIPDTEQESLRTVQQAIDFVKEKAYDILECIKKNGNKINVSNYDAFLTKFKELKFIS